MNPPTGEVISNKRGKIVLREWLLQHRNNPYPTRAETRMLANVTELTTKQVGYWFSNARKRIMQKGEYPGKQTKTDHIILREWLFQHRYRPYPTRAETLILANETENTITQVRNWFSNARKRILPEIIRREGRDPKEFIRPRMCYSLASVTGRTSSTSFSPSSCLEKNAPSQQPSLNILATNAYSDQPLDLSIDKPLDLSLF